MASANKRIMNELGQACSNPVPGTKVSLPDESNVFLWEVIMDGPADSVYAVSNTTCSSFQRWKP